MRTRSTIVMALIAVMAFTGVGNAVAADADLETVRTETIAAMTARIERFEAKLERLDGRDGIAAIQARGLAADGIVIYTGAIAAVEAAGTVDEVREIRREARSEYRAHRRIRRLYTHVQRDIAKFEHRLDRLERAIDRATDAGWDTAPAASEAAAADDRLEAAQTLLDAIDPGDTGAEIKVLLGEAHEAAHDGARHVRAGFQALRESRPGD